jgi:type IV secretory pathway VirB10-like protein
MNKARLLSTVAAALLLTAGIASAQTMNKDEAAPNSAPAAQQKAPAEKIAPVMKPGEKKAGIQRKAPETTGQAAPKEPEKSEMNKPMGKPELNKSETNKPMGKDTQMGKPAEPHAQSDVKTKSSVSKKEGVGTTKSDASANKSNRSTTGQGAASGSAKLSTEQHSKITAIIRQHKVEPAHLNVSIRVGTRVPDSVHYYPLPREVFVIYPQWRGYDYILVGDEILVINPRTHEIVAILDA